MSSPVTGDFATVVPKNADLVRKALNGSVLLGSYPSATVIDTLEAPSGQIAMPTSYSSVGQISDDGLTFGNDTEVSDVRGWGNSSFIRRDIQSEDRTVQFTAWEYKRLTHELLTGLDLSTTEMTATGEWTYDVPDRSPLRYWRVLCIGYDGSGSSLYYIGRFFPRAVVSEKDEQAWSDGDDPLGFSVTMSALVDNSAGFAVREFLFGPGALAAAEEMGITVATP